jgi:hypothetical protein
MHNRLDLIIGASYSPETDQNGNPLDDDEIFARIRSTAEKEVNVLKREFPGHYILRGYNGTLRQNVKHLYLIDGIPSVVMEMIAAMRSPAVRRIAVVGNKDVQSVVSHFTDFFSEELRQEETAVLFEDEGDDLSLLNTIRTAKRSLDDDAILQGYDTIRDPILFLPGDMPFFDDFGWYQRYAGSGAAAVLGLNTKRGIWGLSPDGHAIPPFPRYFHWGVRGDIAKEPGAFLLDYEQIAPLIEPAFAARKTHKDGITGFIGDLLSSNKKGMMHALYVAFRNDCGASMSALKGLVSYAMQKMRGNEAKFPLASMKFSYATLSEIATAITGIPITIAQGPTGPGVIEDVDSLEDRWLLDRLAREYPDVSPYRAEAIAFRSSVMPRLREEILMYYDFSSYLNHYAYRAGAPLQHDAHGRPLWSFKQFTPDMIDSLHSYHQEQTLIRKERT